MCWGFYTFHAEELNSIIQLGDGKCISRASLLYWLLSTDLLSKQANTLHPLHKRPHITDVMIIGTRSLAAICYPVVHLSHTSWKLLCVSAIPCSSTYPIHLTSVCTSCLHGKLGVMSHSPCLHTYIMYGCVLLTMMGQWQQGHPSTCNIHSTPSQWCVIHFEGIC